MVESNRKLEQYIKIFKRRKFLMAIIFVVAFIGVIFGILLVPPSYKAESLLAVAQSDDVTITSTFQDYLPPASHASLAGETYAFILEGYPLAEKISVELKLNNKLEIPAKDIKESIEASFEKPEVLRITVTRNDPENAVLIANIAAKVFLEENKKSIRAEMTGAINYIEKELILTKQELIDKQNAIENFKTESGIIDIELEVKNKLDNLTELLQTKDKTEFELQENEARLVEIRLRMDKDNKTILSPIEDPLIIGLKDELTKLQVELATAKTTYSDIHPRVKSLESQIKTIEADISHQIEESSKIEKVIPEQGYYQELRTSWANTLINIVGLKSKLETLSRLIAHNQDKLAKLPSKQKELRSLILVADIAEQRYKNLLEKLEEAQIEVEKIQGSASIVDLAVEGTPLLSSLFMFLIGTFLSLGLAVIAGFVAEYVDNSLQTAEEATEQLQLAVIGTIPKIKNVENQFIKGDSLLSEAFHKIQTGIKFSSIENSIRTLLITSAQRGEGKSTTIINLGVIISQAGKEVILVDADFRKPDLHKFLQIENFSGLTNVLAGEISLTKALKVTELAGLSLLPAGPQPPNPVDLLESQKMKEVINELCHRGDIILFDCPPVLCYSDPLILGSKLDAVLPIIEVGKTTKEACLNMKNQLVTTGVKVIGVILNKI